MRSGKFRLIVKKFAGKVHFSKFSELLILNCGFQFPFILTIKFASNLTLMRTNAASPIIRPLDPSMTFAQTRTDGQ